jgi:hypothetical protein
MRNRWRAAIAAGVLGAVVMGCATAERASNAEADEYSTKLTFTDRHSMLLQQGREAVAMGRFEEGIPVLQAVADDQSADAEKRAEAMFALGQAHANVLNPKRDVARAQALYERYLAEFPKSKERIQVEEALRSLQSTTR